MIEGIPDDFRDLLVELVDAGARFLVVGGYAVVVREADAGPLGGVSTRFVIADERHRHR